MANLCIKTPSSAILVLIFQLLVLRPRPIKDTASNQVYKCPLYWLLIGASFVLMISHLRFIVPSFSVFFLDITNHAIFWEKTFSWLESYLLLLRVKVKFEMRWTQYLERKLSHEWNVTYYCITTKRTLEFAPYSLVRWSVKK